MSSKQPQQSSSVSQRKYANRATLWKLRTRTLQLQSRPLLMGIVNVTPDSFSDGGRYFQPQDAVRQALLLVEHGANLLDVGGESTRPYSSSVDCREELRRVLPVIQTLCQQTDVPISIDTSKAEVARQAIAAGAEIINDISGLEKDPEMIPLACETGVGLCSMHMQGSPQTMQDAPSYDDVVGEILNYLQRRRDALLDAGVDPQRICLDPGVGFGKTDRHNFSLLRNSAQFHRLGCPLLFGPSRKGFIGKLLGDKQTDRTAGGIGVALALAQQGVQILRMHDIQPVSEALYLFESSGGLDSI